MSGVRQKDPRSISDQHTALLRRLATMPAPTWADTALTACLQHLASSTTTEARMVDVVDAAVDGLDAFWVIYRIRATNEESAQMIGLRRERADAVRTASPTRWEPDDMTDGYSMETT